MQFAALKTPDVRQPPARRADLVGGRAQCRGLRQPRARFIRPRRQLRPVLRPAPHAVFVFRLARQQILAVADLLTQPGDLVRTALLVID